MIGSAVALSLGSRGNEIFKLVRREPVSNNEIRWDIGQNILSSDTIEGLDAVIHFAGENIGEGRWTKKKKERILESRIKGTRLLSENLAGLKRPPKVFITASAVGFYGDRGGTFLTEHSSRGEGFLPEVCVQWEKAAEKAIKAGIRVVNTRFGIVLASEAKLLKIQKKIFRLYLGGIIGSGNQYISWISIEDLKRALLFILNHSEISGPVNLVSPNPITNREFTRIFARTLRRPAVFRIPAFAVKAVFSEKGVEMILSSTRVFPEKLLKAGFDFQYENLHKALKKALILD